MEKRKYPRIKIEEEGIVAVHNGSNRIGKVRDIGLGGLAFEHIYEDDLMEGETRKSLTLLIQGINLSKIPCRIIYNHELQIPFEFDQLAIQLTTRRCGIEFESLTEQQIAQLERLLNINTEEKID